MEEDTEEEKTCHKYPILSKPVDNDSNGRDKLLSSSSNEMVCDDIDALPKNLRYNWFDLLCTLISMTTYIADVVMDCVVAYYFYHLAVDHGIYHYWYFGLTVTFLLLPSLTMMGFSFRWYLMDEENPHLPKAGTVKWMVRLIFMLVQMAPLLRYVESIRYGVLSRIAKAREENCGDASKKQFYRRERRKYYTLMVYEDADATLLRLYESFMESAPQLVVQIYILIKDPHANRMKEILDQNQEINPYLKLSILALSVATSLVSLAWSLVVYHRSLRYTFPDKKNISLLGTVVQFLWNFSWITARVLALSLFASCFPVWIGPLAAVHWMVMSAWVVYQRTSACNTRCEEFLFALVLGAIYIFSFFNAKEERTRYKYLLFYSFCFVENTALVSVWFWRAEPSLWYRVPAIVSHYLAFFGSIVFMLLYYVCCHPTGVELPFQDWRRRREKREPPPADGGETAAVPMTVVATGDRAGSPTSRMSVSSPEIDTIVEEGLDQDVDTTDYNNKKRFVRASSYPPRIGSDATPRRLKYMGSLDKT